MIELTALLSRSSRAIATFLNFYVSHGNTARFSGGDETYYIYFVDNSLQRPTMKEFSNSVNI